jgi:ABC-type branched-subunit amino acid transport system substrate-binding protein
MGTRCAGLLLAAAFACGKEHSRIITIGAIISQTGEVADQQGHLLSAQMAVDEINAGGGVLGGALALVNQDDRSDPAAAAAAATQLIDAYGVPAIIGCITSANTIAVAPIASAREVVLISGSSTAPTITGLSPYVFRTITSDALQGKLLGGRAADKGFSRLAVLYVPGAYGEGLSKVFTSTFQARGGTVVFNQQFVEHQSSYLGLLGQAYQTNPQAILLVGYAVDSAQIIRDYNSNFSSKGTFWFFTDGDEDQNFVQAAGPSSFTFQHEGSGPSNKKGPQYDSFAAAFLARYDRPVEVGSTAANYYDATYLVALALQKAGQATGAAIRDNLRAVSNPPGVQIGPGQWPAALAVLQAGGTVNYDGASGPVDLNGDGEPSSAPYDIWQVVNGKITVVEPSLSP